MDLKQVDINLTDEALKADMRVLHLKLMEDIKTTDIDDDGNEVPIQYESGYAQSINKSARLATKYLDHMNANMLGKTEETSEAFEDRCYVMAKVIINEAK